MFQVIAMPSDSKNFVGTERTPG